MLVEVNGATLYFAVEGSPASPRKIEKNSRIGQKVLAFPRKLGWVSGSGAPRYRRERSGAAKVSPRALGTETCADRRPAFYAVSATSSDR
jgi:hypothetical protein